MEKSSKRGKIPQKDWPSIISRYEAGETLASIARTYDCSPPAISYIVSRSRARSAANPDHDPQKSEAPPPAEPQLVKASAPVDSGDMPDPRPTHNGETPDPAGHPLGEGRTGDQPPVRAPLSLSVPPTDSHPPAGAAEAAARPVPSRAPLGEGHLRDGDSRPVASPPTPLTAGAAQPNGESRRTLHLSLPSGNGNPAHGPHAAAPAAHGLAAETRSGPRGPAGTVGFAAARPAPVQPQPVRPAAAMPARAPATGEEPSPTARDSEAFIDHALRERINTDIAAFLSAFDAALAHDSAETRAGLREATDRLLRAGARTRIELERLEARVPLSSREAVPRPWPGFRSREGRLDR